MRKEELARDRNEDEEGLTQTFLVTLI